MGIRTHKLTDFGLASLFAQCAGERQEEALVTGHATYHRCGLSVQGTMVGIKRYQNTAKVGDVLTARELSVYMNARIGLVMIVLAGQLGGLSAEVLFILPSPPVDRGARAVEVTAFVIEGVCHFVANDGPDAAVVDRCIVGHVEIGRLQDGRRKKDGVG